MNGHVVRTVFSAHADSTPGGWCVKEDNIGYGLLQARDYKVQVTWVGLVDEESTREPMEIMFKDVPKCLVRKLKRMSLPRPIKTALRQRCGMEI